MKSLFKYSLIASVIVIIPKLVVFLTHSQFVGIGVYSGLISLLFISIPLIFAIRNKRNELGGFIRLREVMNVGLAVSVISGLIIAAFNFIYYKFIDHETLAQLIIRTEDALKAVKKNQSEIDVEINALKEFYSPFKQATGVLTGVLTAGVILSFLSSTFLVKNPPSQEN
ncbi:MAG TPA: DUF4199 domain-containing protein [Bacteroidia bacterium]